MKLPESFCEINSKYSVIREGNENWEGKQHTVGQDTSWFSGNITVSWNSWCFEGDRCPDGHHFMGVVKLNPLYEGRLGARKEEVLVISHNLK